jgi:hypothetical protein
MNKDYQINLLSSEFYNNYPSYLYPEMELKQSRPFLVLIVKIDGYTFAIVGYSFKKSSYQPCDMPEFVA